MISSEFSLESLISCHTIEESEAGGAAVPAQPRYYSFLGYLWMLVSVLMLATSTTFAKLVYVDNPNLDGMDYMLVRSTTIAIVSTIEAFHFRVNILHVTMEGRLYLIIR